MVDWRQILQDLDWDTDERKSVILQERLQQRARQYASQTKSQKLEKAEVDHTVLAFDLGSERFAVDVMLVRSVREIERITPVPGTPAFYPGVVNIRGKIITVLDLRLFFGIDVADSKPPKELIVVNVNALEIGILVHHVRDVMPIYNATLESLDDMRYARGMAENQVVFLDFSRLFEDERLVIGSGDE